VSNLRSRSPRGATWRVPLVLGLLVLVLSGLAAAFWPAPVYEVTVGDTRVAAARDPATLAAALSAWSRLEVSRTVALEVNGLTWEYSRGELGLILRPDQVGAALDRALSAVPRIDRLTSRRIHLRLEGLGTWDPVRLEAALAPARAAVERLPEPAQLHIEGGQPVITPETDGIAIDPQATLTALQALGTQPVLHLPVARTRAQVTRETLSRLQIRRLIAEWTTDYDPTIPRAENVARAARAFNGLMLKPGEILSYNAAVGPINSATGWKEAYVIVGGELVPGVGGGVCQVATTLYGAALRANLEIMERHPHQLAVTYIAPSQDAAIAQGYEDLKLRNNTQGHVLIQSEAAGGRVSFRIFGDLPEDQQISIESRVLSTKPFPTRVVADSTLAPGQQHVKLPGNVGVVSEGYRVVYRGGKLVKRELLSRDSYLPTTEVVVSGPGIP